MKTQKCHCCDGTGRELDPVVTGKVLRAERFLAGLTQREIARRMGLSFPYLSQLEGGTVRWSESLVKRYQEALLQP